MVSTITSDKKRFCSNGYVHEPELSSTQGQSSAFSLSANERWFVVRSLPHQEGKAEHNLRRQGYRVFLPRMTTTVRHARKIRKVISPIFPSYMFVIVDLARDRWRPINSTFGVASMIMALEKPAPVPHGVVECLVQQAAASSGAQDNPVLREGDAVRLVSGPFTNALGSLERLDANGRVKVLLDIMGGVVSTYADQSAIEPA